MQEQEHKDQDDDDGDVDLEPEMSQYVFCTPLINIYQGHEGLLYKAKPPKASNPLVARRPQS